MKKIFFLRKSFGLFLFLIIIFLGVKSVFATPAGDNILISEVEYDPVQGGTDQSHEWFELYNPTGSAIDISGYQFTDGEPAASPTFVVIPNGTTLGSGEYFLAVFNTVNFQSEHSGITPDLEYGSLANASNFSLSNGGDEITLKDSVGTNVDFVSWENHTGGWNIAADAGESIARNSSTDTDTATGWIDHQVPTPGTGALAILSNDFVITVKTDNAGISTGTQFTIPTTGGGYNYNVDCNNDGTDEATAQSGDYTCDYGVGNEGTYTIRIKDNVGNGTGFPRIFFNNVGDKEKILSIEQWGTGHWTSMQWAFRGAVNLVVNATDTPNLLSQSSISLHEMFRNAATLGTGTGNWNWNTRNVSSFSYMFDGATSFNKDITSWDVSRASQANGMFRRASAFNQDISSWTPTSMTSMDDMFYHATSFNQDIGSWDVSRVTRMNGMFDGATSFDQDLSSWNMEGVTDVTDMFSGITLSTANYDALLNSWNAQVLNNGNIFSGGNSTYCAATIAHNNMTNAGGHNWTITDGGLRANCNAPTNITLTNDTVDENSPTNQLVGNLAVVDPDGNGVDEFYQVDRGLNACATPGADDGEFVINGNNQLGMINSANYEVKSEYYICIRGVDDDSLFFDKNFTIHINDVNDAPIITSDGGGDSATVNVAENSTVVTTVISADEDELPVQTLTYSITGGADQTKFTINGSTGALTFVTAPDFESPADIDANNTYVVEIEVVDSGSTPKIDTQVITVVVMDVAEGSVVPIYRLYNTKTGAQLYTRGEEDKNKILSKYKDFEFTDGVPAFYASTTDNGTTPIYRLYNKKNGAQLYTRGEDDKNKILNKYKDFEFTDGAPAFYASLVPQSGLTPIYRLYNTRTGMQLYTRGQADKNKILSKYSDYEFTDGAPAFYAKLTQ